MPPWPARLFHPTTAPNPPSRPASDDHADADRDARHGSVPSDRNNQQPHPSPVKASATASRPSASTLPRGRPHARSLSHPFPSLFGGGKKKNAENWDVGLRQDSDGDYTLGFQLDGHAPHTVPAQDGGARHPDEGDLETGNCMTCDSRVRWPRSLKVFRCGACLMVNDLEPLRRESNHLAPPGEFGAGGAGSLSESGSLVHPPISIDKTKALINSCIVSYLKSRQNGSGPHAQNSPGFPKARSMPHEPRNDMENAKQHKSPSAPLLQVPPICLSPAAGSHEEQWQFNAQSAHEQDHRLVLRRSLKPRSSSDAPRPSAGRPVPVPAPPTRQPPPPPLEQHNGRTKSVDVPSFPRDRKDNHGFGRRNSPTTPDYQTFGHDGHPWTKHIFRALEDYIVSCFSSYECLNGSFANRRPVFAGRTRSEGSARTKVAERSPEIQGGLLSDLDPKTLLIGDFAENGAWWSGRVERHHSHKVPEHRERQAPHVNRYVHPKTPRINWGELSYWYEIVLSAGRSWRECLKDLTNDEDPENNSRNKPQVDELMIEEDLRQARSHVQRVLMKATENILKRPGRPLKEPDDIRFLLLIIFNPLLHPSPTGKRRPSGGSRSAGFDPQSPRHNELSPRMAVNPNWTFHRNIREPEGHHFGAIKRILGLLANTTIECHRCLISWFSRLPEDHFRRLVDMVGGFVTYRLTRQNGKKRSNSINPTGGLIPDLTGSNANTSAQLHAALGLSGLDQRRDDGSPHPSVYSEDWQLKAAAKVMALLFSANNVYHLRKAEPVNVPPSVGGMPSAGLAAQQRAASHGQLLPTSDFYNSLLDYVDLIADFEIWESRRGRFSFCQYPFFLSIGAKIRILEHDARRQMESKAREAFFDSLLGKRSVEQHFHLRVRRDCLVEDSLSRISEVVGAGQEEIKKSLRVHFVGEEGIDAGGLRKEWFLLLVRDVFDPNHGMFVYDQDSQFCYFNPSSFETSDQYFLVGALLGLAIYNSTILDVALPPFAFKKLLASAPAQSGSQSSFMRVPLNLTLDDLAEFRPALAHGLRQLLEFDGDVEATFCRDFVADVDTYGSLTQIPLCADGEKRAVTNDNRQEFVDLYVRYLLDTAVARQFEPFKRGFFTVCGGNALSLFRPEEIELLVRGSDEPLDVMSVRAVAVYEHWTTADGKKIARPGETVPVIKWFWELFETANPRDQRKILSFVTGSDRIPAVGATNLVIKISCLGDDCDRFPIARTCFNMLQLYTYRSKQKLVEKLWRAVIESEGFGLK